SFMRIHSYPKSKLSHDVNRKLASNDPLIIPYGHLKYLPFYWLKPIVSLNIQKSAHIGHNVSRLCAGRGFYPGIVLLKTFISRIRNLSTEDDNPAWRIADVGNSFFIFSILLFVVSHILLLFHLQIRLSFRNIQLLFLCCLLICMRGPSLRVQCNLLGLFFPLLRVIVWLCHIVLSVNM